MGLIEDLLNRLGKGVSAEDVPSICVVLGFFGLLFGVVLSMSGISSWGVFLIFIGILLMAVGIIVYVWEKTKE